MSGSLPVGKLTHLSQSPYHVLAVPSCRAVSLSATYERRVLHSLRILAVPSCRAVSLSVTKAQSIMMRRQGLQCPHVGQSPCRGTAAGVVGAGAVLQCPHVGQ